MSTFTVSFRCVYSLCTVSLNYKAFLVNHCRLLLLFKSFLEVLLLEENSEMFRLHLESMGFDWIPVEVLGTVGHGGQNHPQEPCLKFFLAKGFLQVLLQ